MSEEKMLRLHFKPKVFNFSRSVYSFLSNYAADFYPRSGARPIEATRDFMRTVSNLAKESGHEQAYEMEHYEFLDDGVARFKIQEQLHADAVKIACVGSDNEMRHKVLECLKQLKNGSLDYMSARQLGAAIKSTIDVEPEHWVAAKVFKKTPAMDFFELLTKYLASRNMRHCHVMDYKMTRNEEGCRMAITLIISRVSTHRIEIEVDFS